MGIIMVIKSRLTHIISIQTMGIGTIKVVLPFCEKPYDIPDT